MENSQLEDASGIEVHAYTGDGFCILKEFEGWKVGFLRYSDQFSGLTKLERHMETDEVFVLLEGSAILYTGSGQKHMKKNLLYNIPKGVWHHIVVSEDATVLVIENSNTTAENTERRQIGQKVLCGHERSMYVNQCTDQREDKRTGGSCMRYREGV